MCKPCVNWKFEATETWGLRFDVNEGKKTQSNAFVKSIEKIVKFLGGKLKPFKPIVTKAADWEPINGFIQYDNIFPHIAYGFRNRTVPIAIYHVCSISFFLA